MSRALEMLEREIEERVYSRVLKKIQSQNQVVGNKKKKPSLPEVLTPMTEISQNQALRIFKLTHPVFSKNVRPLIESIEYTNKGAGLGDGVGGMKFLYGDVERAVEIYKRKK